MIEDFFFFCNFTFCTAQSIVDGDVADPVLDASSNFSASVPFHYISSTPDVNKLKNPARHCLTLLRSTCISRFAQ